MVATFGRLCAVQGCRQAASTTRSRTGVIGCAWSSGWRPAGPALLNLAEALAAPQRALDRVFRLR
jgi:hypothetical protein